MKHRKCIFETSNCKHFQLSNFLLIKIYSETNENYSAHGMKVVEFYKANQQGLVNLERKWREHFLTTMKPKYMPDLWSVEHNVER